MLLTASLVVLYGREWVTQNHGEKYGQQLHQRYQVVAQRVVCYLQVHTPDLVSAPYFVAVGILRTDFFELKHLENLEENDHMVGSCLECQTGGNYEENVGSSYGETEIGGSCWGIVGEGIHGQNFPESLETLDLGGL